VCHPICYPKELDLSKHISVPNVEGAENSPTKFNLVGVLEHHSERADSGHYTATLKQPGSSDGSWWQFNDSNVSEVTSPGQVEKDGLWSSKSAYMLIYCRSDLATPADPSSALPEWVQKEVERSLKEDEERIAQQRASHRDRDMEDENMRANLQMMKGEQLSKLSVVPSTWLHDWVHVAGDSRDEDLARLDYSDLLLPSTDKTEVQTRRFRLNPFTLWDGRAKILPTDIFRGGLVKSTENRQQRLIPNGLSLEHVVLETMLDADVAKNLKDLLICTKAFGEVITKMRDASKGVEEQSTSVLVRSNFLTSMMQKQLTVLDRSAPPPSNKRKKLHVYPFKEVWSNIKSEVARYQKAPLVPAIDDNQDQFFNTGQRKANTINVDIGGDLRCPHGMLVPGLKPIPALRADVDNLLRLSDERSRLWKALGFSVPSCKGNNLLPARTAICETCKKEKTDCQTQKRAVARLQKQNVEQFPTFVKGELPLTLQDYLEKGKYYLISEEWRQKFAEYIRSPDKPDAFPPVLEPGTFRCVHGRAKYDPATYFERCGRGSVAKRHPHCEEYVLIPEKEFKQAMRSIAPVESDYSHLLLVEMDCQIFDFGRLYTTTPNRCHECAPLGVRTLEVELLDQRQASKKLGHCGKKDIAVKEESSGSHIKIQIIQAYGIEDVTAGQILICTTKHQLQLGDLDTLEKILDKVAGGPWYLSRLRVGITAELFDEDMSLSVEVSEPQVKKPRRDSLLSQSKLAAACA